MAYSVKTIAVFEKQTKRLIKKYPSLKKELMVLIEELKHTPDTGTPLGKHCYKIRLAIASKGKGKSGGARIITNIVITQATVYLITIYDKNEKENLTDNELNELLQFIPG